MPEPTSTLLTLHGLVTGLIERVQDRKLASEMRDVQRLVVAMQSEHFALHEKCLQLQTERAKLEQRVMTLEPLVASAEKKRLEDAEQIAELSKEVHRLAQNDTSYKMKWGCLVFEGDENLYCPGCFLDRGKKIPTSRFNSSARFCSACKTGIPSG
jgi:hypothetical protein